MHPRVAYIALDPQPGIVLRPALRVVIDDATHALHTLSALAPALQRHVHLWALLGRVSQLEQQQQQQQQRLHFSNPVLPGDEPFISTCFTIWAWTSCNI